MTPFKRGNRHLNH